MFRRGFRIRPLGNMPGFLNPMLQRILGEANRAFESGDFSTAAARYSRLAERAAFRGKSRAGNWLVKAGQANTLAGNKDIGIGQVFKGLNMLLNQGRHRDLGRLAWRTSELFNENGLTIEADQIANWLQKERADLKFDKFIRESNNNFENTRQSLPSKCSSCGAPVHPNTVDWVENGQAACGYCGCLLSDG